MAHSSTIERKRLQTAIQIVDSYSATFDDSLNARLSLLECVSCRLAGISLTRYYSITGYDGNRNVDSQTVAELQDAISRSELPLSLALAALARTDYGEVETKRSGSVYTDFRLAKYIAKTAMSAYTGGPIIDPSCGTSILLASCAEIVSEKNGDASQFVSEELYGIDLSHVAIRGSILVLASFLHNSSQLDLLMKHFVSSDSLELGNSIPSLFNCSGFSLVIGNPPWERVRPSRNEFAREHGVAVDYGAEIDSMPKGYEQRRNASRARASQLSKIYGIKGSVDLYRAFINLGISICSDSGTVALYLPAGLIRSKTLSPVRNQIVQEFGNVTISVFTNRAHFFAIDSRFKFVLAFLKDKHPSSRSSVVTFRYCSADEDRVVVDSSLPMGLDLFSNSSLGLGSPEVRTPEEECILRAIWANSKQMRKHPLFGDTHPLREIDMTLDRHLFKRNITESDMTGVMPVLEGRMLAQYRCGCKAYLSGSGRSAKWKVLPIGNEKIVPQFYVEKSDLSDSILQRSRKKRIGFCDIAGQTNERAMQAAFIPAGCVCGNKVPTLLFENDRVAKLWLGIANSFVFDWVIRRYITTTINFFILESLPFPQLSLEDESSRKIIDAVDKLLDLAKIEGEWTHETIWQYSKLRAEIDSLVFFSYGLQASKIETILSDFPLVDQVNARHYDGARPTIDLVRASIYDDDGIWSCVRDACERGALPYLPNEYSRSQAR